MAVRLYAPTLTDTSIAVELPDTESHHAVHVLRLGPGDAVLVFNGVGLQAAAEIETSSARRVTCRVTGLAPALPELLPEVTVAVALLKGHKMDDVVRDVTMLGARCIQPFGAARSERPPRAGAADAAVNRWRRVALASVKQCGRATLPVIAPFVPFDELVASRSARLGLLLVEPALSSADAIGPDATSAVPAGVVLATGPEGGWTPAEVGLATDAGWHRWRVATATLRAEAAPTVGLGILQYLWLDRRAPRASPS